MRGRAALAFVLGGAAALGLLGCPKSSPAPTSDAGTEPASSTMRFPETDAAPMAATSIPPEEVAKMVNPKGWPAYAGPTGSVEGTIRVVGDPPADTTADFSKCPGAADVWGKQFRAGPPGEAGARALGDAIVAVTGYKDFFVPAKREAEAVTIQGCGYPRTITMTFGQRLEVKNATKEFWTPTLAPAPNPVLMMAAPGGDAVRLYPNRPGRFLLLDHDRTYANADVFVMLHPLHATTDTSGHYRIDGVPVGKLKVHATHPRVTTEASADVDIQPNVVARVDLTIRNTAVDASAPPAPPSTRPVVH